MSSSPFLVGPDLVNGQAVRRSSGINQGQHTASAARGATMAVSGSHSSPGISQHNVPSPATFAKMAAAVGVQNPLLEDPRRASGNSTDIVAVKQQNAYAEMMKQAENFLNVQLDQLESAGKVFFDQYEGALNEQADSSKVVEAHRTILALYDQLITSATQLGLAALPCPLSTSEVATRSSTLEELHTKLSNETKDTFERRERLREGASIVTSILTQTR